jgi:hypothetical protein
MRETPKMSDGALSAGMSDPMFARNKAQDAANASRERVLVSEILEPK